MKTRSIEAGMIRNIKRLRTKADRVKAWALYRSLPPSYFAQQPGSQAVIRERRRTGR